MERLRERLELMQYLLLACIKAMSQLSLSQSACRVAALQFFRWGSRSLIFNETHISDKLILFVVSRLTGSCGLPHALRGMLQNGDNIIPTFWVALKTAMWLDWSMSWLIYSISCCI